MRLTLRKIFSRGRMKFDCSATFSPKTSVLSCRARWRGHAGLSLAAGWLVRANSDQIVAGAPRNLPIFGRHDVLGALEDVHRIQEVGDFGAMRHAVGVFCALVDGRVIEIVAPGWCVPGSGDRPPNARAW